MTYLPTSVFDFSINGVPVDDKIVNLNRILKPVIYDSLYPQGSLFTDYPAVKNAVPYDTIQYIHPEPQYGTYDEFGIQYSDAGGETYDDVIQESPDSAIIQFMRQFSVESTGYFEPGVGPTADSKIIKSDLEMARRSADYDAELRYNFFFDENGDTPDKPAIDDPFTISLYYKSSTAMNFSTPSSTSYKRLMYWATAASDLDLGFELTSGGAPYDGPTRVYLTVGAKKVFSTGVNFSDGEPHHIAVVYSPFKLEADEIPGYVDPEVDDVASVQYKYDMALQYDQAGIRYDEPPLLSGHLNTGFYVITGQQEYVSLELWVDGILQGVISDADIGESDTFFTIGDVDAQPAYRSFSGNVAHVAVFPYKLLGEQIRLFASYLNFKLGQAGIYAYDNGVDDGVVLRKPGWIPVQYRIKYATTTGVSTVVPDPPIYSVDGSTPFTPAIPPPDPHFPSGDSGDYDEPVKYDAFGGVYDDATAPVESYLTTSLVIYKGATVASGKNFSLIVGAEGGWNAASFRYFDGQQWFPESSKALNGNISFSWNMALAITSLNESPLTMDFNVISNKVTNFFLMSVNIDYSVPMTGNLGNRIWLPFDVYTGRHWYEYKEWGAEDAGSYFQNGEQRITPRIYQGYLNDNAKNQKGAIFFDHPDIRDWLSTRVVLGAWLYLNAIDWHEDGVGDDQEPGGTVIIGTHNRNAQTAPGQWSAIDGKEPDLKRFRWDNRSGPRWIEITNTDIPTDLQEGKKRGIIIGPGPSDGKLYYGSLDGTGDHKPMIRMYTDEPYVVGPNHRYA